MAKDKKEVSGFRRFYRIFRWFVLLALVLVIVLALKHPGDVPEAPDPAKVPEQAREFETKLQQLQEAHSRGDPGIKVEFSSDELNAFLAQSITQATPPSERSSSAPRTDTEGAIKYLRIRVQDDAVVAYFVVDFHGRDLDVTVSGQPGATNGYLTFAPTGFKVGSLPIPIALAGGALQKRLNEPEMHEKLKLPDFIGELRIQDEQIVLIGK